MESITAQSLTATLALVGMVILVGSLLSGLVERSRLPQVAVFLALGAALGPAGLGFVQPTLDSPAVRIVATLSLVLVLFTDALSLNLAEVRRSAGLALLVLGPATLLSAGAITLLGWWLLGLALPVAVILGAALASTDPVQVRDLLRSPGLSSAARQLLRLESGLNDVVLLPIVLVAMLFLGQHAELTGLDWARLGLSLLVLGPGAGVVVGLLGVSTLEMVRRRIGIRRDYESLYSLGIAFSAYALAEAVHGSGFLAAFAAGLTVAALDVELCDCFLEYGETTAEMALLFTFVLFGSSLIWSGLALAGGTTLLFAAIVLLLRVPIFAATLARTRLDRTSVLVTAWFGPRGLSSLLLVLLVVFAGLPGGDQLFAIASLVVLMSVVLHGGSLAFLPRLTSRSEADAPAVVGARSRALEDLPMVSLARTDRELTGEVSTPDGSSDVRMTLEDVRRLYESGEPFIILDVRTDRTYDPSDQQVAGAIRISPAHPVEDIRRLDLPRQAWLVGYCT